MLLILDSGHCENVKGKESPNKSFREWEFNNDMQYRIQKRAKVLFISIHANAYGSDFNSARGTETYIASNASSNSKKAARFIQDEVVKVFREIDSVARDRGVKVENFTVIYKASMPSVLVEYGFYTNLEDLCVC